VGNALEGWREIIHKERHNMRMKIVLTSWHPAVSQRDEAEKKGKREKTTLRKRKKERAT